MNTKTQLSPLQSSECHKHGHRLARLANAVAHHVAELNAKRAEHRAFVLRAEHAIKQYNNAIAEANEFLGSIDYSEKIPEFDLAIQNAIEYNESELDLACGTMADVGEEE